MRNRFASKRKKYKSHDKTSKSSNDEFVDDEKYYWIVINYKCSKTLLCKMEIDSINLISYFLGVEFNFFRFSYPRFSQVCLSHQNKILIQL